MDTIEIVGWVLAIAGVASAVYFKQTGSKRDFYGEVYEKQQVARDAVQAVRQLWNSGQIPESAEGVKDASFLKAAEFIRSYYPGLTDAQLEMTIEAAVFWLKEGSKRVTEGETSA